MLKRIKIPRSSWTAWLTLRFLACPEEDYDSSLKEKINSGWAIRVTFRYSLILAEDASPMNILKSIKLAQENNGKKALIIHPYVIEAFEIPFIA